MFLVSFFILKNQIICSPGTSAKKLAISAYRSALTQCAFRVWLNFLIFIMVSEILLPA